jgi:diaminohydroxyphosphoribosylaminopyrimidine deaminase/5-amino-6-(5-phosphoribosylamino)uracil reductase
LIAAGIRRVVIGHEDPDPRVDGGGVTQLRAAGIAVEQGLCRDQVAAQLCGFLLRQQRGRGRLRIKIAASLDGRSAMASGESQWITGPQARRDVQRLRAESCAIVTGVGTVLADDCALTVRDAELPAALQLPPADRRALRVVLDSTLRTPPDARVLQGAQRSLLVHGETAKGSPGLAGVDRCAVGADGDGLDLAAVLGVLADRECNEILLESGPTLAGAVLQAGLADELVVYLAPKLLGSSARPMLALPLAEMAEAYDLTLTDRRQLGADLRMTFSVAANRS